jgi:arginase family enzyme
MVARLIHRHAIADRCFPGASTGQLADVTRGDIAIFGVDAVAALAIRDAANAHSSRAEASRRRIDLGNLGEASDRLPAIVHDIEAHGARPFMLGGDLELGTALIDAFASSPDSAPWTIILLSPRLDVRLPQAGTFQAVAIGTQRLIGQSSYGAWRAVGGAVVPAAACEADGADAALALLAAQAQTALLLVDLAVIDTGYAAGASSRNVGGLSPMVVLELTDRIISRFDVRALALLNLAPERDPRGHSERIAALIAERVAAQGQARQAA